MRACARQAWARPIGVGRAGDMRLGRCEVVGQRVRLGEVGGADLAGPWGRSPCEPKTQGA